MAKMFYTLEEAAEVLGKSTDDVKAMADRDEVNLFKDGDRLMFKKEQIDLLAGGDTDSGIGLAGDSMSLADDLEPLSLTSSGSGSAIGLAGQSGSPAGDAKEQTGISIFDAEETENADPAAQTQVSELGEIGADFASGDAASSGSGLLDLTREADDTSLGADLLGDDVYGQDTMSATAADTGAFSDDAGGALFESTEPVETAAPAAISSAPMAAEAYDGAGSGLVGGLTLAIAITTLLAMTTLLLSMTGSGAMVQPLGANWVAVAGGLAVATLLFAGLGWFLGRRS